MLTAEQIKAITVEEMNSENPPFEVSELLSFFSTYNDRKFNLTKLAEELSELSEVTLKMVNKSEKYQPDPKLFIEESGDTFLRMIIAGYMMFPEKEAEINLDINEQTDFVALMCKRMEKKLKNMIVAFQQGKYKNGI